MAPTWPWVKVPACVLVIVMSAIGLIGVLSVAVLLPVPVREGSVGSVGPAAAVITVAVLDKVPVAVTERVPDTV